MVYVKEVNAMSQPSTEVKVRWMQKAYRKYVISLRYDRDQAIIDFIEANKEKYGTTNIIRDALEMYIEAEK